jgi:hypothetical protein
LQQYIAVHKIWNYAASVKPGALCFGKEVIFQ